MTMRRTIGMTLGAVALGWVLLGTAARRSMRSPPIPLAPSTPRIALFEQEGLLRDTAKSLNICV